VHPVTWLYALFKAVPLRTWIAMAAVAGLGLMLLIERDRRLSCQADLAEVKAAYTILAAKVEEQNAAVDAMHAHATEVAKRAREALAAWRVASSVDRTTIASVRARAVAPTPSGIASAAECDAAQDTVRAGMR
jgi:hypothetical protein